MLIVLTGESASGKTTLCHRMVAALKARGIDVAGVLTLPRLADGEKIGMDVMNARTGEGRLLAGRAEVGQGTAGLRWRFAAEGLEFGQRALRDAIPCTVLVVDELGPLELLRGEGWTIGIEVLQSQQYQHALVVIRPSLLANLQGRLKDVDGQVFTVTLSNRDELYKQLQDIV